MAKKAGKAQDVRAAEAAEDVPFEDALERLEALVDALEDGELELEESLRKFEEGVRLVRGCSDRLRQAELRVKQLEADAERDLVIEEGS
jgi:exodeoxyribonuclease VII small subunit